MIIVSPIRLRWDTASLFCCWLFSYVERPRIALGDKGMFSKGDLGAWGAVVSHRGMYIVRWNAAWGLAGRASPSLKREVGERL